MTNNPKNVRNMGVARPDAAAPVAMTKAAMARSRSPLKTTRAALSSGTRSLNSAISWRIAANSAATAAGIASFVPSWSCRATVTLLDCSTLIRLSSNMTCVDMYYIGGLAINQSLRFVITPQPAQADGQDRAPVPVAVKSESPLEFEIVAGERQRFGHLLVRQRPIAVRIVQIVLAILQKDADWFLR